MTNPANNTSRSSIVTLEGAVADRLPPRLKWDQAYAELERDERRHPVPFVADCLPQLPTGGQALDVAAGAGRHTIALAKRGLRVHAVDISWQGLDLARRRIAQGLPEVSDQIGFIVADLEHGWLPNCQYDVIVVTFFLHRPLLPLLKDALLPGGWLIYETFTVDQMEQSDHHRHSTRRYFLQPDELRQTFLDFNILFYDEGAHHGKTTAQLLARKPNGTGEL